MPKHNKRERRNDSRFVKIDYYILNSKAWKELTPRDVRVWLSLCRRFNGVNNGRISLSIREAASEGKMGSATASKAIKKLIAMGFIKKTFGGSFSQKKQLASEFALTHVKLGDDKASKEFMKWKPEKKTVPKQEQVGIKLDAMTNENVI